MITDNHFGKQYFINILCSALFSSRLLFLVLIIIPVTFLIDYDKLMFRYAFELSSFESLNVALINDLSFAFIGNSNASVKKSI